MSLAEQKKQAIILTGAHGVGKTYLAKEYSKMLSIPDFYQVEPKVDAIRTAVDSAVELENPLVLCIENLDLGVAAASYTLLKFLEEPRSNVYIVITCRNSTQIPDTILSRAMTVSIPSVSVSDIELYAKTKESPLIAKIQEDKILWRCIKCFNDLDDLLKLSDTNISYFKGLTGYIAPTASVSSIVWKLQKFPNNTPIPTEFVLRYLMYSNTSWYFPCLNALNDLAMNRMSAHAILSKLAFELKYAV